MEKIRYFALGGLDENGRNMSVLEIDQELYIIDAGLKYPENEQLGVQAIIPDFSYILKNKNRVRAVFITHGHDDVMGALPYLIAEADLPIYTTPLVSMMLKDLFREHGIKKYTIHTHRRNSHFKIGQRQIRFFSLTHSIPDAVGVAIQSQHGYLVHSGEFIMDFNTASRSFDLNLAAISDLGRQGVFLLLSESVAASREGFTAPDHRIERQIEPIFEDTRERIIVSLYEQNIYRLIEVIEMAKRYRRKIYFYGEKQRRLMHHLEKLNYFTIPKQMLLSPKDFHNNYENVVVIVSDVGPNVFRKMGRIALGEDPLIQVRPKDTFIIASPVVPGTEKLSAEVINELYKEGVRVEELDASSMHASEEDIRMMLALLKPRHFIPIKGSYRDLLANVEIAKEMGLRKNRSFALDNGQIAYFEKGRFSHHSDRIKLEDVLIDGHENLDTGGLVLRDRKIISTDGTIIVGIVIDQRTKKIIGGPDVQSRGVIYLKDARNLMNEIGKILEETIQEHVKAKEYRHVDTRNEARKRISKYVFKETGKRPMIMPVIIELRR